MIAMIANHPYIACLLFWLIGLILGWLGSQFTIPRHKGHQDEDITGIGA